MVLLKMKLCQINLKKPILLVEIFAPINFRAPQKSFFRAYQLWEGISWYPTSILSFFKVYIQGRNHKKIHDL